MHEAVNTHTVKSQKHGKAESLAQTIRPPGIEAQQSKPGIRTTRNETRRKQTSRLPPRSLSPRKGGGGYIITSTEHTGSLPLHLHRQRHKLQQRQHSLVTQLHAAVCAPQNAVHLLDVLILLFSLLRLVLRLQKTAAEILLCPAAATFPCCGLLVYIDRTLSALHIPLTAILYWRSALATGGRRTLSSEEDDDDAAAVADKLGGSSSRCCVT